MFDGLFDFLDCKVPAIIAALPMLIMIIIALFFGFIIGVKDWFKPFDEWE